MNISEWPTGESVCAEAPSIAYFVGGSREHGGFYVQQGGTHRIVVSGISSYVEGQVIAERLHIIAEAEMEYKRQLLVERDLRTL